MKNGYDQFFKNARKAAGDSPSGKSSVSFQIGEKPRFEMSPERREEILRKKLAVRKTKKKKSSVPIKMILMSFVGVAVTGWGFLNAEKVEATLKSLEISFIGGASAAESPTKKSEESGKESKDAATSDKKAEGHESAKAEARTGEELDHLSKLTSTLR